MQLACQCPYQWTISDSAWADSGLARRKIVYRALLGRVVSRLLGNGVTQRAYFGESRTKMDDGPPATGANINTNPLDEGRAATGVATLVGMRLGRLSSREYADWPTFLRVALTKLSTAPNSPLADTDIDEIVSCATAAHSQTVLSPLSAAVPGRLLDETDSSASVSINPNIYPTIAQNLCDQGHNQQQNDNEKRINHVITATSIPFNLPRRLACLHVLRAFMGPLIESLIIADRLLFLAESLESHEEYDGASGVGPNGGDNTKVDIAKDESKQSEARKSELETETETERQKWVWRVSAINIFRLESGSARNVALVAERMPLT